MLQRYVMWLLILFLAAGDVEAELTEDKIIEKELAWAKRSVAHLRKGFSTEHPLKWEHHDEALFEMPVHVPIVEAQSRNLRSKRAFK